MSSTTIGDEKPAGELAPPSSVRVLYSFPHKIGAGRICDTAWYQVVGAADAGIDFAVYPGVVHRSLPPGVSVSPTLARGRLRIPYRAIGHRRAYALHDARVSRALKSLVGQIDVVHLWPLGARRTLVTAKQLGIPTVLERANAHTRLAYDVVAKESARLGVELPSDHEHAFNADVLRIEEEEYALADYLLCPSDFVVQSFLDEGFGREKLLRHIYGYDQSQFFPAADRETGPFRALFVGVAAVRKGLHFALEAWLRSPASNDGTFTIAGEILPSYGAKLEPMLSHPSVRALGHRTDVPELMRSSDVLVLPSIEEGFGLVCVEAMGSGVVPLVSNACTDECVHLENALVHDVGDVDALEAHLTLLHEDRAALARLRTNALTSAHSLTWGAAGRRLADLYRMIASSGSSVARVDTTAL
jgi:glycosyltransferase involved in cell wall biosynthesis